MTECWGAYGEVVQVGQEDVALDDLGNGGAGLLEDGLEVLAALLGLVGNGALDHGALGSEGDLAGAVDGRGGLDGLGLRDSSVRRPFFLVISSLVGTQ